MKKIALLLAFILLQVSAYAQEKVVSDTEKKHEISIRGETPRPLQSKDFTFAPIVFESDYNKNYTGLYFQQTKKHAAENILSVYTDKKQPEEYLYINTYNNSSYYDAADGFSLGRWNNKKGFALDISLGGKCGL